MDTGDSNSESGASPTSDSFSVQSVKVAVNIRPLITHEIESGFQECVAAVPGIPQIQVASGHSFTFDNVYGGGGRSMSYIFEECVLPLVEGLFQGYNATVLAYGQTGSGKTHTMGTGFTAGVLDKGIAPRVMEALFQKVSELKKYSDFNIRVSLIEIHQEEIRDLLEANEMPNPLSNGSQGLRPLGKSFGSGRNSWPPGSVDKQPITIRELPSGVSLLGVTEQEVMNEQDMLTCLENGLLFRATGSHSMNARSSRSHAIFTIIVEQRRRWNGNEGNTKDEGADLLCAKMHLVDLAGSERIKRTKSEGMRLREGIHINKGLLALGNVISALGDDKLRKLKGHVPYRDSKLTRLLQDSLGGNSRTVMVACVSPADSNLEETLNTLKYANRARNIQNKPTINRLGDSSAIEIRRLRHQIEILQSELANRGNSTISTETNSTIPVISQARIEASEEMEVLKQRIKFLETTNSKLRQGLAAAREEQAMEAQRCAELETRNANLMTEIVLASEEARKEMQVELDSGSHTSSQLWNELDRVKKECREEVERARAAETGVRSQLAALLDIAHSESEKSRAKAAELKLALVSAQEKAKAEAEKVAAAQANESQLRAFLLAVQETARAESKRARVAESVIASLREEILSLREKAMKEGQMFWEMYSSMQKELSIARMTINKELQFSASAQANGVQMAAGLMAAEERARLEAQKVMDAQSMMAQMNAKMTNERDRPSSNTNVSAFKLQSQFMAAQEAAAAAAAESTKLPHEQGMVDEKARNELIWNSNHSRMGTKSANARGEIQWLNKEMHVAEDEKNRFKMQILDRRGRNGEENERTKEMNRTSSSLDAAQYTNKVLEMELSEMRGKYRAEVDKLSYREEENDQLKSQLTLAKERERELERRLHTAELEMSRMAGEKMSVSENASLSSARAEKFQSIELQLREELGRVKEIAKLEGEKAEDAMSRLSAMSARAVIAEEKAREEEEKSRNATSERDYYLEVALAGNSPGLNSDLVQSLVFLYPKIDELAKSGHVSPSQTLNFALHNMETWQHEKFAKEIESAILIQSIWKMHTNRRRFILLKRAVLFVQARWRLKRRMLSKKNKAEREKKVTFYDLQEDKNGSKSTSMSTSTSVKSLRTSVVMGTPMTSRTIPPSSFVESEPKDAAKVNAKDAAKLNAKLNENVDLKSSWGSKRWAERVGFTATADRGDESEGEKKTQMNGKETTMQAAGAEERRKENGYEHPSPPILIPIPNLLRVESSPSFRNLKNGGLDASDITGLLPGSKEKKEAKQSEKEKTETSSSPPPLSPTPFPSPSVSASASAASFLATLRKKGRELDKDSMLAKDERDDLGRVEKEKETVKSFKVQSSFSPVSNPLPSSLPPSSSPSPSPSSSFYANANGHPSSENARNVSSSASSTPAPSSPPITFTPKHRQLRPVVHAPRGDFSFRPTLGSLPEAEQEGAEPNDRRHVSDSEPDSSVRSKPSRSAPMLPSRLSPAPPSSAAQFMITEFNSFKTNALILVSGDSSRVWGSTALGLHGKGKDSENALSGFKNAKNLNVTERNWEEYCEAVHREKVVFEPYVFNKYTHLGPKKARPYLGGPNLA